MAYSSRKGRKPLERASKISHAEIINNPQVQQLLGNCRVPAPPDPAEEFHFTEIAQLEGGALSTVIAVDGGFRETFIRPEFPSASITFFSFGPLLLKLADLRDMDCKEFIEPEDLKRLKNIERFSLALPTKGVVLSGQATLPRSFRRALHEYMSQANEGEASLNDTLKWLLFRQWSDEKSRPWRIPACPDGCEFAGGIELVPATVETVCPQCGQAVYVSDALRLYERVEDEQGAGAVSAYLMTTLEHLVMVHVIRAVLGIQRKLLSEILFIKDGPLAFFGVTAPLRKPMQELCEYFDGKNDRPHLRVVGVEKSGAFVDHALAIEKRVPENHALLLQDDYIYKYIIPGERTEEYGFNTYYGRKLIYKSASGGLYVCTVPVRGDWNDERNVVDQLAESLAVLGALRCAMYENALLPVALANKLVSLSDYPSTRILTAFAREEVAGG